MEKEKQSYQDYLSVHELAKETGQSPQWIYRLIKTRESFRPYVVTIDGRQKIKRSAIKDYFGFQSESEKAEEKARQEAEQRAKEETAKKARQEETERRARQEAEQSEKQTNDFISFLKEQIREKDRQISELNERLKADQVLLATANQRILLLEQKVDQATTRTTDPDQDRDTTIAPDPERHQATTGTTDPTDNTTRTIYPANVTTTTNPTDDTTTGTTKPKKKKKRSFLDWLLMR